MTVIFSSLSVAEATTGINAVVAFVRLTLLTSLAVLLVYLAPKTNSALSWSSVSRTLHSSIWPTLLSTDSSKTDSAGAVVSTVSYLTLITTILIMVAGVTLPLGLRQGPPLPTNPRVLTAHYLPDASVLGQATTTDPHTFLYGRVCGTLGQSLPCPGNTNNPNTTSYPPSIAELFNSTIHGPFSIQYRRPFNTQPPGSETLVTSGVTSTAQSLLQREGAFVVEGLIVDMSIDHPGIGFLNQSVPDGIPDGGEWSQEVLWLEPVTACANTNLTADYIASGDPNEDVQSTGFNFTDHGGLYALTQDIPQVHQNGQSIDLTQLAYQNAVLSNLDALQFLNATRESSFEGKQYEFLSQSILFEPGGIIELAANLGRAVAFYEPRYTSQNRDLDRTTACGVYNRTTDVANMTTIQLKCSAFLGPPFRADGGDSRVMEAGSRWRQQIHICASATRASIQTVTMSVNSITNIQAGDLNVTVQPTRSSVLWGMERTDEAILDINLLWGRVSDELEGNPALWTIRNETFYLPAGREGTSFGSPPAGEPLAAHAVAWTIVHKNSEIKMPFLVDYSPLGNSDFNMQATIRSFVNRNPILGHAHIRNAIWTDIMANMVVGTITNSSLLTTPYEPSLQYDFRFAIPGFILGAIWAPAFFTSLFLLVSRMLKLEYMKEVLNHTSVGRAVMGCSLLRVSGDSGLDGAGGSSESPGDAWASTPVTLHLSHRRAGPRNDADPDTPRAESPGMSMAQNSRS